MRSLTDFLGREIKAGDTLIYPVRRGSSMVLKKITVTSPGPTYVMGVNDAGRLITLRKPERSIFVRT